MWLSKNCRYVFFHDPPSSFPLSLSFISLAPLSIALTLCFLVSFRFFGLHGSFYLCSAHFLSVFHPLLLFLSVFVFVCSACNLPRHSAGHGGEHHDSSHALRIPRIPRDGRRARLQCNHTQRNATRAACEGVYGLRPHLPSCHFTLQFLLFIGCGIMDRQCDERLACGR